jgi:uncharacterized protein (TIGR02246 family)
MIMLGLLSWAIVREAAAKQNSAGNAPQFHATPAAGADSADGDRDSILKSAREFADAFNKGDAKTIAAMWTENGELREPDGMTLIGHASIEKAYAESFKANPGAKVEVLVKSVRFPAKGLAVEEGLLRYPRGTSNLSASTAYIAVHVREGDQWKMALSSEGSAGQDRIEDLDWLLGEWTGKQNEATVTMLFARDSKKPAIIGTITSTGAARYWGSGTIRIAADPETGQIRSWTFEDDGAHSQSLWFCDGKSWLLDSRGVLASGFPTAERIVLQRAGLDVITWRAIDRLLGETPLPDTAPLRLTRKADAR